jgi:hypothetical protein
VLRDITSLSGGTQDAKPSVRLLLSLKKYDSPRMLAQVDLKSLVDFVQLVLIVIGGQPLQVTAYQGMHEYYFSPIRWGIVAEQVRPIS